VEPIRASYSTYVVGSVAVRVRGIEPLPDYLVMPAYTVVCAEADAIEEVRRARLSDVERQYRVAPSVEESEDEWPACPAGPPRARLRGERGGTTGNSGHGSP
jgi:hypothetical protein